MSNTWIKINAQAELRANLRSAIKAAGLTQAAAAKRASVNYTHLTGALNCNNWLTREAAEALAAAIGVELGDLLGNSIFKGDPTSSEFDFMPPAIAAWKEAQTSKRVLAEPTEGRTRALCCECGSLRTVATREVRPGYADSVAAVQDGYPKMVRILACATCNESTKHAVLRVDDRRDALEEIQRTPTAAETARRDLQELLDHLSELNVDVHPRTRSRKQRTKGFTTCTFWDESKGRWRIEMDPNLPIEMQLELLRNRWKAIALNDWGEVDWDPKEGVVTGPSEYLWSKAAETLIEDLDRFLMVERRRMVAELRDELQAAEVGDLS